MRVNGWKNTRSGYEYSCTFHDCISALPQLDLVPSQGRLGILCPEADRVAEAGDPVVEAALFTLKLEVLGWFWVQAVVSSSFPCSSTQTGRVAGQTGAPLNFDFTLVYDIQSDIRRFHARLLQRAADCVIVLFSGVSQLLDLYLASLDRL